MSTQALTIRIAADASGAISVISQTTQAVNNLGNASNNSNSGVASLSGGVQNLGRWSANSTTAMASLTGGVSGLSRSTIEAINGTNRLNQSLAENTRVTNAATGSMNSLKSAALGLMSVLSGREIIKQMDAWASLEGRLKLVSGSMNELRTAQVGLSQIAQSTRTDLESTTNLYFKMAQATRDAGKSQQELLRLVETTNKAIIIGGSGAVEAKNALIQFGQALASNRLGGDELRSMVEQTPRLVMAIRDGLGATTAEFKRMAEAGALTTQVTTDALAKMVPRIEKEFSQMPLTIGQSFTLIGNALTEFIGKGGQTSGVAQGIAESMRFAAGHVTELANALGIAVGGFVAYKAAVIAAEIHTAILTRTMQLNPFVAVATAIGIAATALYEFRDSTISVNGTSATLGSTIKVIWNDILNGISRAISAVNKFVERISFLKSIKDNAIGLVTGSYDYFLGQSDYEKRNSVKQVAANGSSIMQRASLNDLANKQAANAVAANQDQFLKDLQPTAADISDKKVKESNDKRLAFDKLFADSHKKLVIEEGETLKAQTAALGRELSAQEKLMIHNTVFASEIRKNESAAKKVAHKEETDAMRAAKKEQAAIDKFSDNDPLKKYQADMRDLAAVRGKLEPETFLLNEQKIAAEFEKSTVGIEKLTEAERERQRVFEQTARGKFEKIDVELRAGRSGMSENEYLNKQKEMVDAYLKDTGNFTKDNSEQITKAYENEVEALQKIRRELTMNDREQYEASQRANKFSDERIANLMREYDINKSMTLVNDLGLSAKKIGESFGTMFKDIALNGKSATQALGDMFKSMMNRITSTILDFIAQGLVQKMFSGFSGATGGLFSGLGGTVTALVGAVALGTYMGLQKHGSGIAATISQTSKYPNGVPADASLMLKTDAAVSNMVFLQASKFADQYNENLRDVLSSGFGIIHKNAESIGGFISSSLNTYFPDFMKGLGELSTGISATIADVLGAGKELIAKGADAVGLTTDAVKSLSESKLNAVFDKVGGAAAKSMEKLLGTVAVIVSVGTEVYSLVSEWSSLKGVTSKVIAVADAVSGIAGTYAIAFMNPVSAAVAAIATVISQVGSIIKDGFTTQNIIRVGSSLVGAAIGTMIFPGLGTMIGYVLGDVFGKFIGSFFGKQKKFDLDILQSQVTKPDYKNITTVSDNYNVSGDWKGRRGEWDTALGSVGYGRTQGLNYALTQEEKDYTKGLADIVQGLANTLNSIDISNGLLTDTTNSLFRDSLVKNPINNRIDANSFDSALMADTLFSQVVARLSYVDTASAKKASQWLQIFIDAYPKEYTAAVISSLTSSKTTTGNTLLFELAQKPVEFIDYVGRRLKALARSGKTNEEILKDVSDAAGSSSAALEIVTAKMYALGIAGKDNYSFSIELMDSMDLLGMSMFEAATMTMTLADAVSKSFSNASNLVGDELQKSLQDAMSTITLDWNNYVKNEKLTGGQSASAFQSSLNIMMLSKDLGLAGVGKLDVFGGVISGVAKTNAEKDNAYKSVDDANLALVKAQQSKSGVAEAQVFYDDALKKYNKDFETYLTKAGGEILNNMLFIQNIYLATNKKIADSMTASDFISSANKFVDALGGIDKAMQITDENMKLALGENGFLKWKADAATNSLDTALSGVGETIDTVINAYLNHPLDANLARTVSLLGDAKDAQKAYNDALSKVKVEAVNYLMDFSRSIKTWVDAAQATKIGTPTTQIDYAGKSFAAQLSIAKGIGSSAEEKRAALGGITGYADTFIESIKNYYGSSEAGMKMIEQVVSDVSGLEKSIPIEQLQLGALEQIKSGIYDLPVGLGVVFDGLVSQVAKDKAAYDANPNAINALKLDADSKLVLSVVNAKSAGANSEFIDALLKSFTEKNGIQAYLDFVINSANFDTGEKLSKIDDAFKSIADRFSTDTAGKIQTSYDLLLADLAVNPIDLVVKNEAAKLNIHDVNISLMGLNGISVDRIVDIQTATATANVANLKTAFFEMGNEAQIAIDKANTALILQAQAMQNQANTAQGNSFLESQAVNAGYGDDYTNIVAMQEYITATQAFMNQPLTDGANYSTNTANHFPGSLSTLPNGYSIPVMLHRPASNDSGSSNNAETIKKLEEINGKLQEQLKQSDEQNRNLAALVSVMQAALQENRKQANSLDKIQSKTRIQARQ
jgi:tape measure domain-containing protein